MNEQTSKTIAKEVKKVNQPDGTPTARTIDLTDEMLVEKVRGGDMDAFGELVERYQLRIYNLTFRMTGKHDDAAELAQETFLRALQKIDQFHGKSRFYTWLFRVAANMTLSHRRRAGKVKFHSLTVTDTNADDPDNTRTVSHQQQQQREKSPMESAEMNETNIRVAEALEELDEDFRVVVVLRDMEDMDYARIGEVLDLPIGTVKSRLHRARGMLKDKLTDLVN